ncbi:hypothetical protein PG990_000302 [Apiospora arundinis]|uniref:Ilp is an apoptosis inhibitor n=1 Tax=Apiospora arundinis TaxID=335852 RepID=A0ABR2HYV0_9PEZI
MAFHPHGGGGPSSFPMFHYPQAQPSPQPSGSATSGARGGGPDMPPSSSFFPMEENHNQFDILEWYPHFQSCVRYFLDHAQHSPPVQAVAAFINIQLPFQKAQNPVLTSRMSGGGSPSAMPSPTSRAAGKLPMPPMPSPSGQQNPMAVTLNPYIRRLVVTGFDFPAVLHGFFGDSWALGIGPMHEVERRNYLFAAKSASWLDVKSHYDMGEEQSIPFLRPLQNVTEKEIISAESNWSEWLAMQDWMVGPRSPEVERNSPIQHIKMEDA